MTRPGSRFLGVVAGATLALDVLLQPARAEAQEDHAASRRIGDTTFLLPGLSDSAFLVTELGLRQGVTYQRAERFPIGAFARYRLQWAALDEQIHFAVRVTDWLAVFVEGDGTGSIGMDTPSLVFAKTSYGYGGRAGLGVRLFRSEPTKTQITLRGYGAVGAGRTLDLQGLFGALSYRTAHDLVRIVQQTTNVSQLPGEVRNELYGLANTNYGGIALQRASHWTLGYGVYLAQGIVGPLTLQSSFAIEHTQGEESPFDPALQDVVTLPSHDVTMVFDGVLSADFISWKVPIGISAEYAAKKTYRTIAGEHVYVPSSQDFGGGIFYTGRRGLEVGAMGFTMRNLKPLPGFATNATSDKPVGYAGYFVLRALW